MIHEPPDGNRLLASYYVPSGRTGQKQLEKRIRKHIATSLPTHAIPSLFIQVEEWPLTANGKIDKKALPEPQSYLQRKEINNAKSTTEKEVAAIWASLLNKDVELLNIDNNFFELGGHSLLAIKVVAQLNNKFGLNFTAKELFELQTISEIATQVDLIQSLQSAQNDEELIEEGEW